MKVIIEEGTACMPDVSETKIFLLSDYDVAVIKTHGEYTTYI